MDSTRVTRYMQLRMLTEDNPNWQEGFEEMFNLEGQMTDEEKNAVSQEWNG